MAFLHQATASTSQKYHGGERLRCGQIVGSSLEKKGTKGSNAAPKKYYLFTKIGRAAKDKTNPQISTRLEVKHMLIKGIKNAMTFPLKKS